MRTWFVITYEIPPLKSLFEPPFFAHRCGRFTHRATGKTAVDAVRLVKWFHPTAHILEVSDDQGRRIAATVASKEAA